MNNIVKFSDDFKNIVYRIKNIDKVEPKSIYKDDNNIEVFMFNYGITRAEVHYIDGFVNFSYNIRNNVLDDMISSIISEVLKSKPCITFKEKVAKSLTILTCKEWDNVDRDAHVCRFISAMRNKEIKNVFDLKLLTGKSKEYYDERIKKISGVYPGNLTNEEIEFANKCSEYNLYYMICQKVIYLKKITPENLDISEYTLEQEETRFALEYLCSRISRFGVKMEIPNDFTAMELNMDYAMWSNSWAMYIMSVDPSIVKDLQDLASKGIDVYPYLVTVDSNITKDGIKHILIDRRYFKQK